MGSLRPPFHDAATLVRAQCECAGIRSRTRRVIHEDRGRVGVVAPARGHHHVGQRARLRIEIRKRRGPPSRGVEDADTGRAEIHLLLERTRRGERNRIETLACGVAEIEWILVRGGRRKVITLAHGRIEYHAMFVEHPLVEIARVVASTFVIPAPAEGRIHDTAVHTHHVEVVGERPRISAGLIEARSQECAAIHHGYDVRLRCVARTHDQTVCIKHGVGPRYRERCTAVFRRTHAHTLRALRSIVAHRVRAARHVHHGVSRLTQLEGGTLEIELTALLLEDGAAPFATGEVRIPVAVQLERAAVEFEREVRVHGLAHVAVSAHLIIRAAEVAIGPPPAVGEADHAVLGRGARLVDTSGSFATHVERGHGAVRVAIEDGRALLHTERGARAVPSARHRERTLAVF